jgi:membrane protease subunit HflK
MMNSFFPSLWSGLRQTFRLRAAALLTRIVTQAEGQDDEREPRRPRRNQDGPPDLEEAWQDFNRFLNNLFTGKGLRKGPSFGGNKRNGGSGGPSARGASIGVGVVIAVLLALWIGSGFFIVQEGQAGIILQFGKYKSTTGAGFQWRLPYPFQSHEVVNVSSVRTVEVGYRANVRNKVAKESLMLTDDENIIDIQFAVQYRLKDPTEFIFNNRSPDETVMQAAETAVREVVGKSKMDFVLYEGREQVAIQVSQLMQQILDLYKVGVLISSVTMQSAQPPEQVQAAFDDAVKAGQDRERQKNEGQAYANDVIPKARGNASRLALEAEGYKQRVIAQAEGDASRFRQVVTEYAKAPAVTRDRLYLDTMQEIFSNTTKVLVDTKSTGNLLYLPLDKLMQQSQSAAPDPNTANTASTAGSDATVVTMPSVQTTGSLFVDDSRSRDGMRSRETR